jgi:hypothetical protein
MPPARISSAQVGSRFVDAVASDRGITEYSRVFRSKLLAPAGSLLGTSLKDMAIACRQAESSVDLATPFLSADVAAFLTRACDASQAKQRRFLTASNTAAIEGGYLDSDGVAEFAAAGFEIRSVRNLHAKILLTDDRWGLVGSGNLTVAGANGGNAELGVALNATQTLAAREQHFERWWVAGEPIDLQWMRAIERRRKRSPQRRRREGRGGLFEGEEGVDLRSFRRERNGSGYWLKILYSTQARMTARHWRRRMWVSDRHTERSNGGVPLRRPSYKVGDHLVIYVTRGERQACPAVVRVAEEPVFDPALVAREVSAADAQKWSWVTWVEPVASTALAQAPTLAQIGVSSQSVRQQGHIHLSRQEYLRALGLIRG